MKIEYRDVYSAYVWWWRKLGMFIVCISGSIGGWIGCVYCEYLWDWGQHVRYWLWVWVRVGAGRETFYWDVCVSMSSAEVNVLQAKSENFTGHTNRLDIRRIFVIGLVIHKRHAYYGFRAVHTHTHFPSHPSLPIPSVSVFNSGFVINQICF